MTPPDGACSVAVPAHQFMQALEYMERWGWADAVVAGRDCLEPAEEPALHAAKAAASDDLREFAKWAYFDRLIDELAAALKRSVRSHAPGHYLLAQEVQATFGPRLGADALRAAFERAWEAYDAAFRDGGAVPFKEEP